MASDQPFRLPITDLLRRPGASRDVVIDAPLAGLAGPGAQVVADRPLHVAVSLERVSEGIVVRGAIVAAWEAACSRCLAPVAGTISVHVDELFERHPLEGETYQLDEETLDLEPMIRDALVLDLPAAPLCRSDCAGLCAVCGADRNTNPCNCTTTELDPRWAALRSLDLQN
ncbi:MAG TPA: DUF177 domain-containing protein [Acidimicrobiia bacterium]|nr:DUF177 domain-containing protein [Acidimicrobiia bacterium]